MTLLEALKKIRDEGPVNTRSGICFSLIMLRRIAVPEKFDTLAQKWPQYSGAIGFPVGGKWCYTINQANGTLWQGEQLDLRMSLTNFCIKEHENENLTSDSSGG